MKFTIDVKSNCLQALSSINDTAGKGLIVLDMNSPVGFINDGDIRRLILNGGKLTDNVSKAMSKEYIKTKKRPSYSEATKLLNNGIKLIPLVSDKNEVLDIIDIMSIIRIPIHDPRLVGNELKYLLNCIETNWISSQGSYVVDFENLFSKLHNSFYTTSTSSGTSALELAFRAVKSKKDGYVLVPDLTFGATINAVVNAGLTPLICPIKQDDFSIDLSKISKEILENTAAICVVHLYGSAVCMEKIMQLKEKYNFFVVEDCAEALGSNLNGKRVGTFGDIATFSFFGNKLITTGEGGMLITKNESLFEFINLIKNHGMSSKKRYWHEVVGTNARMTNIQAAIGLGQLEKLETVVEKKRNIHNIYYERLQNSKDKLKVWHEYLNIYSSYWLNLVIFKDKKNIPKLIKESKKMHIDLRRCFYPMHYLPAFKHYSKSNLDYSDSIYLYDHILCLPSGLNLENDQILAVCKFIESALE